jgi:hypothetical protein
LAAPNGSRANASIFALTSSRTLRGIAAIVLIAGFVYSIEYMPNEC